jgi:hypothetical protein
MNIDAINIHGLNESNVASTNAIAQFDLSHADITDNYILEEATGLDADEIVPQYYGGGLGVVDYYQMVSGPRTVVLDIKLNPQYDTGETPSQLRDALYKAIAYSRFGMVRLKLRNNASTVGVLDGFVTKFEANVFSSNPKVKLTIICPEPLIQHEARIDLSADTPATTVPTFTITDNISTAPHGFSVRLHFTGAVNTSFTITTAAGTFRILLGVSAGFVNNDELTMTSEQNNKELYRTGSISANLADTIDQNQIWPLVMPGVNTYTLSSSLVVVEYIAHKPAFWGV